MENNELQFNNFKIHTQYSICEGAIKIDDLANYCKSNKIKVIGICDSFNLCGALEFSEKLSKVGTQPIIGTQINFKLGDYVSKIPLFASSEDGFKNLSKLSSKSYIEINPTEDPHCEIKDLLDFDKGIIITSGGVRDFFGGLFKLNRINDLENIVVSIKKKYLDRFYLEIQRHNDINEKDYENFLLNISLKHKIPIIASQEVYYLKDDMVEAHDALTCIGNKNLVIDNNREKLSPEHYIKSIDELKEIYKDIPEALENNFNFPLRFKYKLNKSLPNLPKLKTDSSTSIETNLSNEAKKGLQNRLENYIFQKNKKKTEIEIKKIYLDRLNHELEIINSMNYASYFLIVSDYIKWSKKNSIPVGPGRGSGAGSLVAYSLEITDLDPIEFDLIFERFLNPDRISMPDFDIDFCEDKRDKVFEYLKSKYQEGVAHIITFGKFKARMALRDVGRVLGLSYGHVDRICKMIPFDPSRPLTLKESIDREPRFKDEIKKDARVDKLIELSLKIEGLNRNMATHAAGVVIAGQNLTEQIPLYKDHSSKLPLPSTQFDMYSSENAGLVKFDLLGLKTLTVIDKTLKMLEKKGKVIKIKNISLSDKTVYESLSTGNTTGLFQLESTGMREAIKQMKPNKFDDIIALVALYRPGPMSNIPIYNECKNGNRKPDYIHPSLEKILKPTYGIIIYQEQVMQIAQTLAGFSAGEADILRRAMGKKKRSELEKQKENFVNGAVKKGIKKDLANYIFTKIEPFAEYGFNKSHAAAYALIAYQTAYLKTYYKEDFIAATMSTEMNNTDKLREFVEELKRLKVEVVRPNINLCDSDFKTETNKIFYGLSAIKNVGYEAITNIVSERKKKGPFKNINDFIRRIDPKDVNKLQLEGLVKSGSLDCLENNRKKIFFSIPKIITSIKYFHEDKINKQKNLFEDANQDEEIFNYSTKDTWSKKEFLIEEFKSLGFYISDHPLSEFKSLFSESNIVSYKDFLANEKSEGFVAGTLMSIQEKKTSKGSPYAILKFSDEASEFELFIFSEILIQNREILKESDSFILTILKDNVSSENSQKRVNVKKILPLNEMINKVYHSISIELNDNYNLHELKEFLKDKGETKIKIIIPYNDKKITLSLEKDRKFDLKLFNAIKNKEYVRKISF
ncbi:MAG: DNA polymerase III subunit alpha [Candidatus Pelagibacter sp.]|nr:DNA polymerase III subunit alpha [Candidatus Pelagibacter sp.]OUW23489.1 MAG: DNA polymerase III subunit alpha [Rickettsiales bacterium TMED174]